MEQQFFVDEEFEVQGIEETPNLQKPQKTSETSQSISNAEELLSSFMNTLFDKTQDQSFWRELEDIEKSKIPKLLPGIVKEKATFDYISLLKICLRQEMLEKHKILNDFQQISENSLKKTERNDFSEFEKFKKSTFSFFKFSRFKFLSQQF